MLSYYEGHPSLWQSNHFAEWAATFLLEDRLARHPERFAQDFWELKERCARAGRSGYPRIHPQAERIAGWAERLGSVEVLGQLLPELAARKPMPRALRQQVARWRDLVQGEGPVRP